MNDPAQNVNLFVAPNFQFSIKKDRLFRYNINGIQTPLNGIPNYCLLKFGQNNQYSVNIFFPNLPAINETKRYQVDTTLTIPLFVDNVLLRALDEIADDTQINYQYNLHASFQVGYSLTTARGLLSLGHFFSALWLSEAIPRMRGIIQDNVEDLDYSRFEGFFFYTYAFGQKIMLQNIPDGDTEAFQDYLINGIPELNLTNVLSENIMYDLAFVGGLPRQVGFWKVNRRDFPLYNQFFSDDLRQTNYRYDPFALNANLGGCMYNPKRHLGAAPNNIVKFQCYHTLKSAFYIPGRTTSRRTAFDFTPMEAFNNLTRVRRLMVILYIHIFINTREKET